MNAPGAPRQALNPMESLHRTLEAVEALALPEGDFVRIANGLRDVFRNPTEEQPTNFLELRSTIEISFKEYCFTITGSFRRVFQRRPDEYRTDYEMLRGTKRTFHQSTESPFHLIQSLIIFHKPKKVTVKYDHGVVDFHYNLVRRGIANLYKQRVKMVKWMKETAGDDFVEPDDDDSWDLKLVSYDFTIFAGEISGRLSFDWKRALHDRAY